MLSFQQKSKLGAAFSQAKLYWVGIIAKMGLCVMKFIKCWKVVVQVNHLRVFTVREKRACYCMYSAAQPAVPSPTAQGGKHNMDFKWETRETRELPFYESNEM